MKSSAKSKSDTEFLVPKGMVAAIKAERLEELRVRDRALTEEIIRLENSRGGAASNAAHEIDAAARNLITGIAITPTPVRDLALVTRERAAVRQAQKILNEEMEADAAERRRMETERRLPEWRELTRQVAVTVLQLQRLNRAREKIRNDIGGDAGLPCYVLPRALLGDGIVGDAPYRFLADCVAAGIITKAEAQNG